MKNKQLARKPVYSINFNNSVSGSVSKKNKKDFKPSAIAIDPTPGDIYIIEGTKSETFNFR